MINQSPGGKLANARPNNADATASIHLQAPSIRSLKRGRRGYFPLTPQLILLIAL